MVWICKAHGYDVNPRDCPGCLRCKIRSLETELASAKCCYDEVEAECEELRDRGYERSE